jgi:hypothetical protein
VLEKLQRGWQRVKKSNIFHMEKFSLKKINQVEHKGQYGVDIKTRFTVLLNSYADT